MARKSLLQLSKEQDTAMFSIRKSKGAKKLVNKRSFLSIGKNPFLKSVGEGFVDVFSGKSRDRTKKRLVRKK